MATLPYSDIEERTFQVWNSDPSDWLNNNVMELDDFINSSFFTTLTDNPLRLYWNIDGSYTLQGAVTVNNTIPAATQVTILNPIESILKYSLYFQRFSPLVIDLSTDIANATVSCAFLNTTDVILLPDSVGFATTVEIIFDQHLYRKSTTG